MKISNHSKYIVVWVALALSSGCGIPTLVTRTPNRELPGVYRSASDSGSVVSANWREFFQDPNLLALIDTALQHNQEILLTMQEIEVQRSEAQSRRGEYLPFVHLGLQGELERSGRYTRYGAVDDALEIMPGKNFPEPLGNVLLGASASWEIDIWHKLRNARRAALSRYLASSEGKNFMVTGLIAEIASSYFELMALDNQLQIVELNIGIQSDALAAVRVQKESARVTQLAVNRFEAQLLHTRNLKYEIEQQIVQVENRINFLCGRFPQPVPRSSGDFLERSVEMPETGIPSELLVQRPDIRKAELELVAADLDVRSARAAFLPSFGIRSGIGFQAFDPAYLINPESIAYNLAGDLMAPLINRNAIKASYNAANARQVQAVVSYEQAILNAYMEVSNEQSRLEKYTQSFATKQEEVALLMQSVDVAGNLFNSARADYAEVLLTQREALDSKMELVEIRMLQLQSRVNLYRALGGGWQ